MYESGYRGVGIKFETPMACYRLEKEKKQQKDKGSESDKWGEKQ